MINPLIAPMFPLDAQTGEVKYRDQGDAIFAGGVDLAVACLAQSSSTSSHMWSFDYAKWRS